VLEDFSHFKKPFKLTSKITFGNYDDTLQNCPLDKSKIDVTLSIGSPVRANDAYNSLSVDDDESTCTKDFVKLTPIPHFEKCNATAFDRVLSINDISMDMKFEKVRWKIVDIETFLYNS
jgi:hypothetical protein